MILKLLVGNGLIVICCTVILLLASLTYKLDGFLSVVSKATTEFEAGFVRAFIIFLRYLCHWNILQAGQLQLLRLLRIHLPTLILIQESCKGMLTIWRLIIPTYLVLTLWAQVLKDLKIIVHGRQHQIIGLIGWKAWVCNLNLRCLLNWHSVLLVVRVQLRKVKSSRRGTPILNIHTLHLEMTMLMHP